MSDVARIAPAIAIVIAATVAATLLGCSVGGGLQPLNSSPSFVSTTPLPLSAPAAAPRDIASWYGPGFVGHSTSNGERYNPDGLTAASKTLPIGSRVRVTNPANGRSVVVRINDRGPYIRGRTIDLSHRAARQIGLVGPGVAPVDVASVSSTGAPFPSYPRSRSYVIPAAYATGSSPTRLTRHRTTRRHRYRRVLPPPTLLTTIGASIAGVLR